MTIEKLKQEESELREKLSENLKAQAKIKTDAFTAKYGVAVGDRITWTDYGKEFEGIVYLIRNDDLVKVRLLKKDGTVGIRDKRIYSSDFKSIKLVEKAK